MARLASCGNFTNLVLVQEVLVLLVLPHALKTGIFHVKVVQVVVGIELPQWRAIAGGNEVPQEQVDGILLGPICEGVAVVPANGGQQLAVLIHGPNLPAGKRAKREIDLDLP